MLTVNYNDIKEKSPQHCQEVVVLEKLNTFDSLGIKQSCIQTELHWVQYDDKGYATGNFLCFNSLEDDKLVVGVTKTDEFHNNLSWQLEWCNSKNILYWIDANEYSELFISNI